MATLSAEDRQAIWAKYMQDCGSARIEIPLAKAELRAAVDAIDGWVDANAASFNAAIPQPARGALSTKEKSSLLVYVVRKRFEVA